MNTAHKAGMEVGVVSDRNAQAEIGNTLPRVGGPEVARGCDRKPVAPRLECCEPLTIKLNPARVKLAWACGHTDYWPVKLAENKGAQIASRNCPTCRAIECCKNGGHLGTGRLYMGEGKDTWAPGEFIPWLPANDERQPKGVSECA